MTYLILGKLWDWPFLRKIVFFSFFGAPYNFFWTPKPYLASETSLFLGGGHTGNFQLLNHCSDQRMLEV